MADYYTQTVVHQTLPFACMTSLEKLVLSTMFETEEIDGGLYCFSTERVDDMPSLDLAEVRDALKHAKDIPSRLYDLVKAKADTLSAEASELELDLSVDSFEFILQDILRRSEALPHISITAAFTCSKMRPDGFGGMVTLITPEEIRSTSTGDILEDWLADKFP
jgi:hypothetical protein